MGDLDFYLYVICNVWVMLFGASAIWVLGRLESWKRWGYIFGLISQPAWFYIGYSSKQWGVFAISIWYTYSWMQGIYNYWWLPSREHK